MPTETLGSPNLSILLVEDNDDDAALLERHLRRSGFVPQITRVETEADMVVALNEPQLPQLVLADYNLPHFSGPAALQLLRSSNLDIPFIMLSGAVSEETAVSSMRAGAHDYVSKENFARLVPAILREVKEATTRRNRIVAERALLASEARFHSLVEAMPLGLLISDASGRITYANCAAERLLNYDEAGLLGDSVNLTSICPALADAATLLAAQRGGEPFEAVCITHDGNALEVLIGVASLNPDAPVEERQTAAFIADLSMQKKSEEVLRRTEKLAVVGRLAASISHEINNPLEAITNCLYLLSNTELPAEGRHYLGLAQKELDRVTQITVQTLRFYRSSTRPALTDVHELVATVLALLESRFRHQRIEVVRELRSNPLIVAHDGEIRQLLVNLISNAIDAVNEGGCIIIRTSKARDWALNREGIAITVADNGSGMDVATRARIFEPFFSTKGITGTGLGLWISKEIAGKHQGRIRVRSRQKSPCNNGGTVFRLFIPAQKESLSGAAGK
jgi:PAS domain S-box-containing protein